MKKKAKIKMMKKGMDKGTHKEMHKMPLHKRMAMGSKVK